MLASYILFFGFLSLSRKPVLCGRIIGLGNLDYVSHNRVLWKLGKELQLRGHKYTQILPSCAKETYHDIDVQVFNTSVTNEEIENCMLNLIKVGDIGGISGAFKLNSFLAESRMMLERFCEDLFNNKALIAELKKSVDLVLCDISNFCCFILVDMLNVTRVDVSPVGFAGVLGAYLFGFPQAHVYLTLESWSDPSDPAKFSFTNRLVSFVSYTAFQLLVKKIISEDLWEKHAKATSRYSNAVYALRTRNIGLIPHDFALEYPRPLGSNIKVIGPILPEPPHELPAYLNEFMTKSDVVIVVSLGTTLSNYRPGFVKVIAEGLSKISVPVLWKHSGDIPDNLGGNVRIISWIPQNDILGHPSTKVFVTHCGLNSFLESAYHGVSMVAVPLFGDQHRQASVVKLKGLGVSLDKNSMKPQDLSETILEVINNRVYRENAQKISKLLRDRKRTPSEEGADWIEYALHHDGASHLVSEVLDLPGYQLYMLDVLLFLLVVVLIVLFIFVHICCCIFGRKAKNSAKEKQA